MNLWASKKLLNAGIIVALFATLTSVGFLNAPVYADAVSGTTGSPGISELSDRWLRYRAVAGCYASTDIGKTSIDKITAGTWFQKSDLDYNVATGYTTGGDDRKVSCGDGAFVTNSLQQIGFSSNIDSFCSMSTAIRGDSKDDARCINGPGEFDMDGSKTDQFDAFKDAKAAKVSDSPLFPYSINDAGTKKILYWVGRQTLIEACGGVKGEAYVDSMQGNVRDSKRKVVVNEVNLATGEVERFVYNLNKDEGDTIDDVWSETGGGSASGNINSKDMTCTQLAQLTWENDTAFGAFVKAYNTANPDDAGTTTPEENPTGTNEPVCSAGALGWIFCPLTEFISDATKIVAEMLESRLVYPALISSDQGKAIRAVWGTVLGIANLGLAIAFLVVIFSQATSVGLSSYGIKKLLPRVVAAAILMNLSFFICAIAVDLANILGVSIKSIVEAGVQELPASVGVTGADYSWSTTLVAILGVGLAVITGAIALLLPVLMMAFIAVLTALLVIAAREVIITLLIIVAPIAFLAWILPNTEQWFTKWRKLFTTMLLMFPLVMLIFYGSLLVSKLILVTADGGSDGAPDLMVNVIALAVLTIPLFSLPFIMKSAGGLLDRLGVITNNRSKGLVDRSRKKGEELKARSTYQQGKVLRKRAADEHRQTKFAGRVGRGGVAGTLARGVGGNIGRLPGTADTSFGAQSSRLGTYAIQAEREAATKRRQAVAASLRSEGVDMTVLQQRYMDSVRSGDVDTANAQLTHLATTYGAGGRQLAAQALASTDLGQIADPTKREKMRTELNETIGGELYSSLIGSRADIAKGGFRATTDSNGNVVAGSDNSFSFTDISSLTAPQIVSQDKGVHEMARARNQQYNPNEAYIAMTNEELVSKATDSETRVELSRVSGVPVQGPGAPSNTPPPSGRVRTNYNQNNQNNPPPPPGGAGTP